MWMIAQMPTGWHHDGVFMGLHWFWWLFWILVVLGVVWAFWRLVRSERRRDGEKPRSETAEEILRRRFSEGEIDEDEFRRRLRALQESTGSGGGPASGEE
jgi:putative membrane protein